MPGTRSQRHKGIGQVRSLACLLFFSYVTCLSSFSLGRIFRNMDDDGSRSLDFDEFKKGLHDCGLSSSDVVNGNFVGVCAEACVYSNVGMYVVVTNVGDLLD